MDISTISTVSCKAVESIPCSTYTWRPSVYSKPKFLGKQHEDLTSIVLRAGVSCLKRECWRKYQRYTFTPSVSLWVTSFLRYENDTFLRYENDTFLRYENDTFLRYENDTILRYENDTFLRYENDTFLKYENDTFLRYENDTFLRYENDTFLRYENDTL